MPTDSSTTRRGALRLIGAAGMTLAGAQTVSAQSDSETSITILHDTHVHGRLGGVDDTENVETYFGLMNEVSADAANVLRVGAGDDLGSSALSTEFEGKHMVETFEAGNLSHDTFGNHDFDFGPDVLRTRISETEQFQWVSANVRTDSGATFGAEAGAKRYDVIDVDGVAVGITGIITERTPEVTSLGENNTVISPTEALREVVPNMIDDGAQLVIVLSHVANDVARDIASAVDGIDIMVGDDAAEVLGDEVVNDTILSFVGDGYDHLGELTVQVSADSVTSREYTLHTTTEAVDNLNVSPDSAVEETANSFRNQIDRTVIGETEVQLNCVTKDLRTEETNMGNFVADTIADRLGSDVVIQNGGGIRTDTLYPKGEITDLLIKQILPFGNTLTELEVTGATLRAAIENGLSEINTLEGRFPQVSGLSVEYNPDAAKLNRVTSVEVNGEPLDPDQTYTLGTNNFMAGGGDGYEMLADAPVAQQGAGLATAVIDRIKNTTPIAPETEGRITTVSTSPAPAAPSLSATLDTAGEPGGQAVVSYQLTNADDENSVALSLTRLPDQVSVNVDASSTSGTFGSETRELLFFKPGNEVTATIAYDISASASADATLNVTAEALDESSLATAQQTVSLTQQGLVERFDADSDGDIELSETQTAIRSFADGELNLQEIQQVIRAFSG